MQSYVRKEHRSGHYLESSVVFIPYLSQSDEEQNLTNGEILIDLPSVPGKESSTEGDAVDILVAMFTFLRNV